MTNLARKRMVALGIAAAVALSTATPSFARMQSSANAPHAGYVPKPCVTDEGNGRLLPCQADAY